MQSPAHYESLIGSDHPPFELVATDKEPVDILHMFVTDKSDLQRFMDKYAAVVAAGGKIWVSWPKAASKIPAIIKEQDIRDVILPMGWVDTKVCAVSDDWSGLKLLRRRSKA